ncbi:response regulator [Pelagicoccus sp. SDUM812002]|uniref:response regulator n=1 Tax=Pelagicoccus sp. SDUM812002 TaxID=3041266 RepID=UPI00280D59C7|nr:response regulator [Pelagicoccus sp. SDUM812002]MDQ8186130.1 response regulator [Pelagicoccus sp. SDUM812002]
MQSPHCKSDFVVHFFATTLFDLSMQAKYSEIDLRHLENRSVLVVDDNHAIHRDYHAVLRPDQRDEGEQKLDELEDLLLGTSETPKNRRERNFEIQSVYQGEEAYELIQRHYAKGIKYPLAFIDMRMPPGWDGLETIKKLREVDSAIQFIIVTAYSDYSEEEIEQALGPQTPFDITYKPFEPVELYEMTYELVASWNQKFPTRH